MEVANFKRSALPRLLRERETKGESVSSEFQRQCHLTPDLVERLGLEKELEGHSGCVNCIEWSYSGDLLASGSDDKTVILWDGFSGKKRAQLNTVHEGNIFSVKFLPQSQNRVIATAAGDYRVCVQDVETSTTTHNITAHMGRVKRLTVAEDSPGLLWSAAEDGTVMQWDVREKCNKGEPNVLVNLVNHIGRAAECKCIAICPSRPELLAVGANDPYVRVFDRRMLTLQRLNDSPGDAGAGAAGATTNWERRHHLADCEGEGDSTPRGAVAYFVPGHLPGKEAMYMRKQRPLAATYVTYSPDGTQLLVNLGGEQIYLYDRHALYESRLQAPLPAHTMAVIQNCDKAPASSNSSTNGHSNGLRKIPPLPTRVEAIKLEANAEFEASQYTAAIQLYNQAIAICRHPILFGNRGAALMKRRWDGDVYAALRDCHTALAMDPGHIKAHLRLARCLHDLDWPEEAEQCLEVFKTRYPEHVKSQACRQLQEDLASTSKNPTSAPRRQKSESLKTAVDFLKGGISEEDDDDSSMEEECVSYPVPRGRKWSTQEVAWRGAAKDYSSRFCGHCNTTTDIKEANFFGGRGQYVVAGSDDGKFFIWDTETTNIVRVLRGDESIVNCLQGHPTAPILATSGIDPVVRLWQPLPQDGCNNERMVEDAATAANNNQRRMNADPFETILLNMGYRMTEDEEGGNIEGRSEEDPCRQS